MRTIAIENGEAKLNKQQRRTLLAAADLLRGLRQIYYDDELVSSRLADAEGILRSRGAFREHSDDDTTSTDD